MRVSLFRENQLLECGYQCKILLENVNTRLFESPFIRDRARHAQVWACVMVRLYLSSPLSDCLVRSTSHSRQRTDALAKLVLKRRVHLERHFHPVHMSQTRCGTTRRWTRGTSVMLNDVNLQSQQDQDNLGSGHKKAHIVPSRHHMSSFCS